ncbi:FKBP-type peptidyl-prolyl cis-trans isomerase [Mucilaginibacter flavus]|uniref:FKBP-type peptidyl-prolyl cis-trans isomerase n=1 Tax=Mucilaginibacter flavus TaxID=931504 RepID=UPI0025B52130|nr:FKBP-type peptidyl-prolyl cis-trans isomerase [Mucilaginibacter flavus]MDN3581770.1 FKBP-type peptidyl-prolyl cis-trans isomerase [Mucilaginibacter flavus]
MKKIFYFLAPILGMLTLSAKAQVGMQARPNGAQYQIFTPNTGEKIKQNDVITFHYIQMTDKDSVLFSSYTAGHTVQAQIHPSQSVADLMDIFPLLTLNDSVKVKVPTDSIFKGHEEARPPFFAKGSNLIFIIKITKVQSLQQAMDERNAAIAKQKQQEGIDAANYIAANKLTPITTASGLKYIVTKPSALRKPLPGDTVLVNYAGSLTNGKIFDSSIEKVAKAAGLDQPGRPYEPISVVLGQGQVIPGWEEGLALLHEGSAAKFIIPSNLGYGEKGGGQVIPPYATLIFDLEIVKIKPTKHVPVAAKPGVKHPVKKGTAKKTGVSKKTN